jgi:hypothetical protein
MFKHVDLGSRAFVGAKSARLTPSFGYVTARAGEAPDVSSRSGELY